MNDEEIRRVFAANLNRFLTASGIKQNEIAKMLRVAESTVSSWCSGAKLPRMPKIDQLAQIFGVQRSDLLEEKCALPSNMYPAKWREPVPLVGDIACGTPILAEQNITDYVQTPEHIHADFALRCRGESMIDAGVHDGDIVFIRQQPAVTNGQIAAVLVDGAESEATLKRVYLDGDVLTLQAANPAFAPKAFVGDDIDRVHILGLAVAFVHVFEQ